MDDVNARVHELRKALKLTQEEFGTRLGVRNAAISKIENGTNSVSEQMAILICQTFNVSRIWLEDGIPPMIKTPDDDLAEAFADLLVQGSDLQKAFATAIVKLSDEQLGALEAAARRLIQIVDSARPQEQQSGEE